MEKPEKIYKCKYCELEFNRPQDLANHVKSIHKPVKYGKRICESCGKEVSSQKGAYHIHLRSCLKRKQSYKCERCGKEVTEWYGSGRFCSRECSNKRDIKSELKDRIRNKLIENLGFDFYADKLKRVLISLIQKKNREENKNNKPFKHKHTYTSHICVYCGVNTTTKYICKECEDYKRYLDFKNGKIKVSFIVAKRLIEKYEGHKCSICGITEWNGKYLTLVCDHIDGHSNNNSYNNLRLVCSNCDSQLPTYKSKNKHSDRKMRKGFW